MVVSKLLALEMRLSKIEQFHRWAMGNLVDNLTRGTFAEWMVGLALEVIKKGDVRLEWDAYDILYGETKIEVKASGLSQTFKLIPSEPSKPRFDIAPRRWCWDATTDRTIEHDPPQRCADVYVFCLHEPVPATNENVRDPDSWKFWVVSTQKLDTELRDQKTVGLATLSQLASPISWSQIKTEVDKLELK